MSHSFENVRLVIADNSPMVRSGLKAALYSFGFRNIVDTGQLVRLHDLLTQDSADLVISGSEVENTQVGYLIQEVRHHRLGSNPFLQAIILLSNADPIYVRKNIDSGADDLLLMPVAPEQLIARIEKLVNNRKPFIVTRDYIGPDRRNKPRPGESSAPTLPVPNPLKARVTGSVDSTRLMRQVQEAAQQLNRVKIERHAVQIEWLANHLAASIRDGSGDPAVLVTHSANLVATVNDTIKRAHGTPVESQESLLFEILMVAQRLDAAPTTVGFMEVEKLQTQARTLARQVAALSA